MNVTRTPEGAAGEDTRFAIEESVNSHLERMFMQAAKNDALGYSAGHTSDQGTGLSEHRRFEALQAECAAAISFHADLYRKFFLEPVGTDPDETS